MKTIEEAIQAASQCLGAAGLVDSRMESEFLIAAFLKVSRGQLILHRHRPLEDEALRGLQGWVSARQSRKPLAYVTGEQPFRHLNLKVSPDVLIPRPETELLVEQAMRILDRMPEGAIAVDVGTGSGAIAISLSFHRKAGRVIGIDSSAKALTVARHNAKRNQQRTVEWLEGQLLEPIGKRGILVDLVVSNLPYVRTKEFSQLEPELHWEPRRALDGGEDGLRLIEPCIDQAADVIRPGGMLLLEIGADQSPAVIALLNAGAVWADIQMFRDLAGLPRIVQARRSATGPRADRPRQSRGTDK